MRSRAGRWRWAQKVGLPFASVVPQQLWNGPCLWDSIFSAQQFKQHLALCTSCLAPTTMMMMMMVMMS